MTYREDIELLGLDDDCTPVQVKNAFRALALRHHPDLGGDPDAFQRCREAYSRVLADALRRAQVCPVCDGRGVVELRSGFASIKQVCPRCAGSTCGSSR